MANDLVTHEYIGSVIGAAPNFTDEQLDIAVAIARSYCRWHIAPVRTETITLDARGGDLLVVPSLAVVDIDSIEIDGTEVTDFEWSTNGTVERCAGWPRKRRSVAVTLDHGHPECPDEVVGVIAAIASKLPLSIGGDGVEVGVVEEQLGSFRYRLSDSSQTEGQLSDSHRYILGNHRLP